MKSKLIIVAMVLAGLAGAEFPIEEGVLRGNLNAGGQAITNFATLKGDDLEIGASGFVLHDGQYKAAFHLNEFYGSWAFLTNVNIVGGLVVSNSITLGGEEITSWMDSADAWSEYPATQDVDMAGHSMTTDFEPESGTNYVITADVHGTSINLMAVNITDELSETTVYLGPLNEEDVQIIQIAGRLICLDSATFSGGASFGGGAVFQGELGVRAGIYTSRDGSSNVIFGGRTLASTNDPGSVTIRPNRTGGSPSYTNIGHIIFENLPTSANDLPTGAIWNDSGTLKIITE